MMYARFLNSSRPMVLEAAHQVLVDTYMNDFYYVCQIVEQPSVHGSGSS